MGIDRMRHVTTVGATCDNQPLGAALSEGSRSPLQNVGSQAPPRVIAPRYLTLLSVQAIRVHGVKASPTGTLSAQRRSGLRDNPEDGRELRPCALHLCTRPSPRRVH
jgi:hypothetical protein